MYHHITHASPGKPAVASRACTYNSQKWVETQVKKKGMHWPPPVADKSRDRRDGRLYIHITCSPERKSCVRHKRCIARSLIFCFVCPLSLRHVMMTSQNTHDNTPLFSPLRHGVWALVRYLEWRRERWQAALPFSRFPGSASHVSIPSRRNRESVYPHP